MAAWNLAVYSLQLGALAATAVLAASLLRLRTPRFALRFWQTILLAALMLPILQPRRADDAAAVFSSTAANLLDTRREFAATAFTVDIFTLLLAAVALGAVVRLAWLAVGLLRVRMLIAHARHDASLAAIAGGLDRALGTGATLMVTRELEGPATVGFRRPVILIPASVLSMPAAVQRAIIGHELVHVARRDWLQTIAEEIWCAILWFHPAARAIASRLSLARETVVDEMTILLTRDRRAYAEALLAFSDPQPHVVGVTPFIGRRTLTQRISLIAEEDPMSRRRAAVSLVLALLASTTLTAAAIDRFPMSSGMQRGQVYAAGNGVTLPVVTHEVKPEYTREAMQAKIQGSVWMDVVVAETGDVTSVHVTESLDAEHGLDRQAMEACAQWKFKPGMKDGKPVPVRVTIEMTFTLK